MLVKSRLNELEEIIKDGLEKFVLVGEALQEIKNEKLYAHETFEAYCREIWHFGESRAYQLIRSSNISNSLTSEVLPLRPSHVNKLSIIKDDGLRNKAWDEVVELDVDITGDLVDVFAKKYSVVERDPAIGSDIVSGQITALHGYDLMKTLNRLPDYYRELVMLYGTGIQTDALLELYNFEKEFEDEFKEFISNGWLMGKYNIEFKDLTKRDVQEYMKKLYWERRQESLEAATEFQQEGKSGLVITSGLNVAETMHENKDGQVMLYAFPEKQYTPKQMLDFIENGNYGVMFMALYSEHEPNINFGNSTIKPSMVNGLKPEYLIQAFNSSIG